MNTKLTAKQIINILIENNVDPSDFAFNDYKKIEELGNVREAEQVGGEGQGDTWYSVKHFIDHGVYIIIYGSYSSYNGTDFYGELDSEDMVHEVFPANIVKQVYVNSKELSKSEKSLQDFKDKVIAEYLSK